MNFVEDLGTFDKGFLARVLWNMRDKTEIENLDADKEGAGGYVPLFLLKPEAKGFHGDSESSWTWCKNDLRWIRRAGVALLSMDKECKHCFWVDREGCCKELFDQICLPKQDAEALLFRVDKARLSGIGITKFIPWQLVADLHVKFLDKRGKAKRKEQISGKSWNAPIEVVSDVASGDSSGSNSDSHSNSDHEAGFFFSTFFCHIYDIFWSYF